MGPLRGDSGRRGDEGIHVSCVRRPPQSQREEKTHIKTNISFSTARLRERCQRASLSIFPPLPHSLAPSPSLFVSHQINQSIPQWLKIMHSRIKKRCISSYQGRRNWCRQQAWGDQLFISHHADKDSAPSLKHCKTVQQHRDTLLNAVQFPLDRVTVR